MAGRSQASFIFHSLGRREAVGRFDGGRVRERRPDRETVSRSNSGFWREQIIASCSTRNEEAHRVAIAKIA